MVLLVGRRLAGVMTVESLVRREHPLEEIVFFSRRGRNEGNTEVDLKFTQSGRDYGKSNEYWSPISAVNTTILLGLLLHGRHPRDG